MSQPKNMGRFENATILLVISVALSTLCSCSRDKLPQNITYSEHIASIIYKNCTTCHRPGEAGPFNLLTYHDAQQRAQLIKYATRTRFMPPWPADPNYSHFIDEKVLSEEEILMITRWVETGCPIGDSTKIPTLPNFSNGSQLGNPNYIIKMQQPYQIKGNNQDRFLLMRVYFNRAGTDIAD